MAKLRAFLSLHEASPILSPRQIRHRYILWAEQGVLGDLGAKDMSLLVRLLGTLSTSKSTQVSKDLYVHPKAAQMPESAFGDHWDLITQVVAHKRWLKYPLYPSDHYWLLRRDIARFWKHFRDGMALS